MKLDFSTWPDGETRREFSIPANDLHLRTETCTFDHPVAISIMAQKSDEQVVVVAQSKTEATATCVRCLEEFAVPVDESFRAVVRVVATEDAAPDTGDDDFFLIPAAEPVWDISEVVRQLILLAVPDNPLCKEDCLGLCAGCGRNLNTEECVCIVKPSPSGLAKLGELLEKSQKRGQGSV